MKNFFAAIAAVSLFIVGVGAGARPASANQTPAFQKQAQMSLVGPAGYITFWSGCGSPAVGYCGAAWPLSPSGGLNVCHAVPSGANDQFASFSNNSGHNFRVWTNAGCSGSSATLYNGTETGQLASPFYKSISSQQRIS